MYRLPEYGHNVAVEKETDIELQKEEVRTHQLGQHQQPCCV